MERKSAYEQLVGLVSEKAIMGIVDSLASAEYERKEIESLIVLSERLQEVTFTFSDKQLDKLVKQLSSSITALNDFISMHYYPHDTKATVFQLYPKAKYADELKTADGELSSWRTLRQQGLDLGRKVKDDYLDLVKLYQRKEKPDERLLFKHKLPAGTRWEDFIIIIEDESTVRVRVKQYDVTLSFEDMGLKDGRTNEPSAQWAFLLVLAKYGGELKPSDSGAQIRFKKQKQLLSAKLQSYFSIDFDPFYPYERSYRAKFTLGLKGKD